MAHAIIHFLLTGALFVCAGCVYTGRFNYATPVVIPGIERTMKSPGFWISLHPAPDAVVLDAAGVERFNGITAHKGLIRDFARAGASCSGGELKTELYGALRLVRGKGRYDKDGRAVAQSFFDRIEARMNPASLARVVPVRCGFICRYADQRLLPSDEILSEKPGDIEFDELQNSSLDIGVPVIVLHESRDGRWLYAHAADSAGWVKKERIVVCGEDEFRKFTQAASFCVVTSPKADIFWDPQARRYCDYVRMGARFPVENYDAQIVRVLIPFPGDRGEFSRRSAYLRRDDVHIGYLVYTPRTIIRQAFRLLNAPYGWGGSGGEQDCSAFMQEIFSTVGIHLPRNSSEQGRAGLPQTLSEAAAGVTLIQLKGHVLLYLGMYNNRPYAIHETYGFSRKNGVDDERCVINRVIVSDLSLGEGTKKGSLGERIVAIREIR